MLPISFLRSRLVDRWCILLPLDGVAQLPKKPPVLEGFYMFIPAYTIYHPCIVNLRMVYGTMQITTLEIFKIFDVQFLEAKRYLDYLGRLRAFRRSTRRLAARAAVDGDVTCLLPALLSIWSTFGIWTANQHPITSTTIFLTLFHESYGPTG